MQNIYTKNFKTVITRALLYLYKFYMATRKQNSAKKHTVALIHANWCGHCKHMMPEWEKLDEQIGGRVDVRTIEQSQMDEKMPELQALVKGGKSIETGGFPTILKIVNGRVSYYSGNREANEMKAWALNVHGGGKRRQTKRQAKRRQTQRRRRKI
jgi:thiol-disulfide isomerase/thioredoxin